MDRRELLKTGVSAIVGWRVGVPDNGRRLLEAAAAKAGHEEWKFGVMADTQWKVTSDPSNPGTCAVGIIDALNREFIRHGVKFVVQAGDLVDKESWSGLGMGISERTLPYRAAAAQLLYDSGIGFFPVRGNHEGSQAAAVEIPALFPQTLGEGLHLFGVRDVIPSNIPGLRGLSYAFDFQNVRIVLIDQFARKDGTGSVHQNVIDQLGWIDAALSGRRPDSHAFVVGHKNLSGQNHVDCLFGDSVLANAEARNRFIRMLEANNVGYYLGGHDHLHHRSIVTAPDLAARVEQIICASNSYKFYIPKPQPNDPTERIIAHELFTIGYYIMTVEGPCVTVDYYSSSHGNDYGDSDLTSTPVGMRFYHRERFGYSRNGRRFTVGENESYREVKDSYEGTEFCILDGMNSAGKHDSNLMKCPQVKAVKTGWLPRPAGFASAVLKLWGLADNLRLSDERLSGMLPNQPGPTHSDPYVLSLSYDDSHAGPAKDGNGRVGLATRDARGNWVNAVDLNNGGSRRFVAGGWKPGYTLGTYGVDTSRRNVWAVINYDGDFVAF
jgi:hypothetical protein